MRYGRGRVGSFGSLEFSHGIIYFFYSNGIVYFSCNNVIASAGKNHRANCRRAQGREGKSVTTRRASYPWVGVVTRKAHDSFQFQFQFQGGRASGWRGHRFFFSIHSPSFFALPRPLLGSSPFPPVQTPAAPRPSALPPPVPSPAGIDPLIGLRLRSIDWIAGACYR